MVLNQSGNTWNIAGIYNVEKAFVKNKKYNDVLKWYNFNSELLFLQVLLCKVKKGMGNILMLGNLLWRFIASVSFIGL